MLTRLLICLLICCGSLQGVHAAVDAGGPSPEQQTQALESARNERLHAISNERSARDSAEAHNSAQAKQLLDLRKAPQEAPANVATPPVGPAQRRQTGLVVFGVIVFVIVAIGISAAVVARRQIAERDRIRRLIRHIPLAPSILLFNTMPEPEVSTGHPQKFHEPPADGGGI